MKFLKQLSLYTFSGFLGAGINFFIMPVLSHHLAPYDYGLISIFNTYVTILIPLVGLTANGLLGVEYFKTTDKKEFASKFASIQIVPLLPFLILSFSFWTTYYKIDDTLELSNTNRWWGLGMMFLALGTIYVETFLSFLVVQKKVKSYAFFNTLRVLVEVAITIWLVVFKGWGWQGRLYAWLTTTTIFLIISFLYFKSEGFLNGKLEWSFMKEGILFGLPLILHTVSKFVINQSDRLFIAKMVSIDESGIYNIGYTVGALVMIVINAFYNFYSPFLMERLTVLDDIKKLQIVKIAYLFAAGSLILLVLLTLLSPYFFTYFIDKRYQSAGQYVFWVGLGYYFWGCSLLFFGYIYFYKRNKILGWLAVVNVITNIIFNYYFIRSFGALGAAYATTLSYFISMVVIVFYSGQLIKLPWFQFKKAMLIKL